MRLILATALAAALVTAGVGAGATADARTAGPTGVRVTMQLLKNSDHRIVATGHAPPGSRVVVQNRLDKHQSFGTVRSGFTSASGRFRLTGDVKGEAYGKYRVCVLTSHPVCSRPAKPTVRQRTGKIKILSAPTRIVPGETAEPVLVHFSKWLRGFSIRVRLEYQDDHGKWVPTYVSSAYSPSVYLYTYGLNVGSPGLKMRVHTLKTRDVAQAFTNTFTVQVYRVFTFSQLVAVSGSLVTKSDVNVYYGRSVGTAPVGPTGTNSATLALPQNCGRAVFGVVVDRNLVQPADTYTASVAVDGTTLWSHAPADPVDTADYTITLPPDPKQLTLSASYDSTKPDHRPWFVNASTSYLDPVAAPYVLCAS